MAVRGHGALIAAVLVGLLVLTVAGAATAILVIRTNAGPEAVVDPLPPLADVSAPLPAVDVRPPTTGVVASGADPARVASALAGPLADAFLGPVGDVVVDVATGQVLHDGDGAGPRAPASTAKVLTAVTALQTLGPAATLRTVVVAGGSPGEVVLVGGGDVTLTRSGRSTLYPGAASVDSLAGAVRAAGVTSATRVVVDSSRYVGPPVAPGVPAFWTKGNVPPMAPVMIDGGRVSPDGRDREQEPDLVAGRALAAALGNPAAEVVRGTAPAGAREIAAVGSPPVADLVRTMLTESDNVLAEALGREAALHDGLPASFEGAVAAVRRAVTDLGVPTEGAAGSGLALVDASGLSPANRVAPSVLAGVLLRVARAEPAALATVVEGMPVAGYDGTLADRFRQDAASVPGAGVVRAKTGRLPDVASLAGLLRTSDGHLLAFAFLAGDVPAGPAKASDALDRAAAALASCVCA